MIDISPQQFNITHEHQGKRLDRFLVLTLLKFSRSQLQQYIKDGGVKINNKTAIVHQFLKKGDIVSVDKVKRKNRISFPQPKLEIIEAKKDFVIINKPVGILVHPTISSDEVTLADQLLEKFPEIKNVGENPSRPGIVHRLDREVAGLMVIARTWEMYESLKEQFRSRTIQKEYTALVHGKPENAEGDISFTISRSKRRPGRMAAKPDGTGKIAHTQYETLETFPQYTLLKVLPKTGRTHQIRVHLRAVGHPIVGDQLYHSRKFKKELNARHPLLAATQITFTDLRGDLQSYQLAIPEHFNRVLADLRSKYKKGQPKSQ